MSVWTLALTSARHYWRAHLGLLLGAFLASAILTGSLLVGDSVRASLQRAGELRLGKIRAGLLGGDRWFTEKLALDVGGAPVILAVGSAGAVNAKQRANGVQVLGVDAAFYQLTASGRVTTLASGEAAINEALAQRLGLKVGDAFITRLEKPSAISRDAPLSGEADEDVAIRRKVAAILPAEDGGAFQVQPSQMPTASVYLPLSDLQLQLEMEGRVNVLLHPNASGLDAKLEQARTLRDFGLTLAEDKAQKAWMLGTDRVFLDDVLVNKVQAAMPAAEGVLTYLVTGINTAPYSMVTAAKNITGDAVISQWLADDQKLKVGDELDLRYFTMGTGRQLQSTEHKVKVGAIWPMTDARLNEIWTPKFPGISESQNCRDWKPGIPMETAKIRDQDEAYWDEYKATPKAFLPLELGQKLWTNRFGSLTGLRLPQTDGVDAEKLSKSITAVLSLTDIGLVPRDLGAEGTAAARGSVDFGGLFAGLSMFLIAAALIFSALLFLFTLERRAGQAGVLLAVGWLPRQVRRFMLAEAGLVGLLGTVLGIFGGILYTKAALHGLGGAWGGATAGLRLSYHAQPATLIIAAVASLLVMLITLAWVSRKMFRTAPRELLSTGTFIADAPRASTRWRWVLVIGLLMAIGLSIAAPMASMPEAVAGMFFGAGIGFLTAALAAASGWMRASSTSTEVASRLSQIGLRNVTRRPGRSLAAMGMMAAGIFLVVAVNAFRMSAEVDPARRDTGTGGFALVGESSLPIYEDLNAPAGREAFSLEEEEMQGINVLPFRVREGDDASCLNLNAAQNPQLAGVNAAKMIALKAFSFTKGDWAALQSNDAIIPAVVDMNTAMWGLKKGVGDVLDYKDAAGNAFQVRIAALLAGSILQGKVIIDEKAFIQRYPDTAGYRYFLIDAPDAKATSDLLTSQLEQRGLALETTTARLAAFQTVQNTYIGIFTVLGGLGVVLGTFGIGVLLARHVLERKGELGVMQAVGFTPASLKNMVLGEHVVLLVAGLLIGVVSALIAVWPNLSQSGASLPISTLTALVIGILLAGVLACVLAVRSAMRGSLTDSIRRE
jgi:putative ABC transport system permease protein